MGLPITYQRILPITAIVLFALVPVAARAQGNVSELDLDTLLVTIVNENAQLTARELRVRAQRRLVESAGALDDPRVSYSIAPGSVGDSIPSDLGNTLGMRQVFQFSQSIPWPGKLPLRTEIAETKVRLEALSRDELLATLVHRGRELWLNLWFVAAAQEINSGQQALLSDLAEVVESRYASGLGLQQHVLEVQSRRIELEHQQFVLGQQQRGLWAQVNELRNRPPDAPLGVIQDAPPAPVLSSREDTLSRVLDGSPQLRQRRAQARLEGSRRDLVELNDYPDFQFNVGYNELWNDSSLRTQVGVTFSIPLDLGKRTARKAAAQYRYASATVEVSRLQVDLQAEVEQLLSRHEELAHSIMLFEQELIPIAEQTLQASLANYEGGGGQFRSLIEAEDRILTLNLQLQQMRANRLMTISSLDSLSGGLIWPQENQP
ncbi:MAG: TolC family protein [Pseudohongiellaceae bacterium]